MQNAEQLTFLSEEAPAKVSPSRETARVWQGSQGSCSSIYGQFESSCMPAGGGRRDTSSGRTCRERLVPSAGLRSDSYSRSWMNSGTVWRGVYSMRSTPEYQVGRVLDSSGRLRNAAGASSLSEFLEARTPPKYSLSARACEGIIRRAEKRGKPLPSILRDALEWVIARDSSTTPESRRGGVGYELGQSPTLTADYHQPAVLTPWDVQSKRVYGTDDAGPTLPSGTGEGMNIQPIVMTTANTNANGSNVSEDGTSYTLDGTNSNAVCIQGNAIERDKGGAGGIGVRDDGVAYTLDTADRHAVAFAQNTRDEVRIFQGDGQVVGALAAQPGMKQTSYVMTQYGEVAGTLRARADSSPCVDSGQNVVCMESAQTRAAIEVDLPPTLNASHEQPIVCAADDNGKAAIEEDLCGSLKVGGGSP